MRRDLGFLLIFAVLVCGSAVAKQRLAIAAVFQNEGRFLREWIEYHKLVGVEHFYLYNNLSDDDYLEVLQPYIESGEATLLDWPDSAEQLPKSHPSELHGYRQMQYAAYYHAIKRSDTERLALIDIDEFLVPANDSTLLPLLEAYRSQPNVGSLCLPCVMFGTSGVDRVSDDRLMIEMLLLHWPCEEGYYESWAQHQLLGTQRVFHHKSIVRPECVRRIRSAHAAILVKGKVSLYVPLSRAQVNHYRTFDETFLREVKIARREKWDCDADWCLSRAALLTNRSILGERILRFVPQLRKALGLLTENTP